MDIANTPAGDIPPPPFTNSINQLRGFSTALSEFLSRYDELQNQINSSTDSKLPGSLVDTTTTTNPNLSALTNLSDSSCNQSIDAFPKVAVSDQIPNYQRRDRTGTATESTVCLLNSDGISTFVDAWTAPTTRRQRRLKELYACSSVNTDREQIQDKKRYKGVRMRKWGKWIAEVREPYKPSRIWLGTYSSAVAAARAYDTAAFYLYGPEERLNFPDLVGNDGYLSDLSNDSVRKKAMEVGAKVDALENQKGSAPTNCEDFDVDIDTSETEDIDTPKKLEVIDTSKKHEQIDIEETEILKKPEQTIILNEPKEIDILEKVEQTDVCKNSVEICSSKNLEETETAKKDEATRISKMAEETLTEVSRKPIGTGIVSVLECLCRNMYGRMVRRHVTTYLYEMHKLHKEIANALKLAVDPAKLVLDSIGTFFLQGWRSFWEDSHLTLARLASVLILECFVMISDGGIEISKTEKEYAEQAATDWRNRMIKEGGLGQTDEIDARGLLLFISGFGTQDDVFKIQDIVDLIRASNVKEISNSLRGSVSFIQKIPEVIDFMVKNKLEIEAADIAYTFGLEDVCHPENILRTYLNNLVKDIQNGSSQTLEALKQHLCDLKSVKQFLQSRNVDPSVLLPDFKMNETIQNLERETNEGGLTQKRKLLENLIHLEADDESMQKPVGHAETDSSKKSETVAETYAQTIKVVPESVVCKKKPVGHAETDSLKKSEATVAETSCAHTITAVAEAVVCIQKPAGHVETDSSKKSEATVAEASCTRTITAVPEALVSKQNPSRMTTNHKQTLEKVEVADISKKPGSLKKLEETETESSKESVISVLESLCQNMSFKKLKTHLTTHFSEVNDRYKEIVKAMKLAADPAKLVLYSIGTFFVQSSRTIRKDAHQTVVRLALVLILKCFLMISSDGIEIANTEREYAAETAAEWRNRMITEGGLGYTDEVDARGLLLFISGFGIQDDVFMIQDIVNLIRASNVKGIASALRGSVFFIAKLPEVIDWMVKRNLQIEAADIVYTFGLEDKCCPQNILRTYLHNLVKDIQNDSSLQTLETRKQQLSKMKCVKQCLESHNIDPSILLPDFKVNEMIEYLLIEVNVEKMILKRKSLEDPTHQEAKRVCFNNENMPHQHRPALGHHGMVQYNLSTQPSTHYFDNSENIDGSVPNVPAYGLPGSYDQSVPRADVPPYGWRGPNGQTYDSQPYGRQCERVPPEPFSYVPPSGGFPGRWGPQEPSPGYKEVPSSGGFPGRRDPPEPYHGVKNYPQSGGFPRRQGPSADLYSFVDKVLK